MDSTVDKKAIKKPTLVVSDAALSQIHLISENDFTLEGQSLRIQITGKGCHGFDYSVGFAMPHQDVFVIEVSATQSVLVDPFTAFYLKNASLDFHLDVETGDEGFLLSPENPDDFAGKFWRKDDSKVPPTKG